MQRRTDLVNSFEEVEIEAGTLMEEEDLSPANIYFVIKGQVALYKRPEGIYTAAGERIRADDVDMFCNPKDSGLERIGI